jgi:AmmeMemoRadiSam system protein B
MLTFTFMEPQPVRRAAVAGQWYPGRADDLGRAVDAYCAAVPAVISGDIVGMIVPHAGLVYSGPVAAHAYRQLVGRAYDVVVLVGPSHHVGFEGVAVVRRGAFDTPLGPVPIAADVADAIVAASPLVHERPAAHAREHSLEMQLPFLQRLLPGTPIVPLVMGHQTPSTVEALGDALGDVLASSRALLIASSDLSHYNDAARAARLDGVMLDAIRRFDPEAMARALGKFPDHACGGGPMLAVLRAARALGAADAEVVRYADSGDVSGDKTAVVGYVAALLGTFDAPA